MGWFDFLRKPKKKEDISSLIEKVCKMINKEEARFRRQCKEVRLNKEDFALLKRESAKILGADGFNRVVHFLGVEVKQA